MYNGMMDPELIRLAQEQMNRMSPAEFARIQQQMMSNPELLRMASEGMKNLRPEDIRNAAEQLKHTRPEEMAEIGEKMANASPEEIATMRARLDGQVTYEINAAQMLKKQGNQLHSQGKYRDALQKYLLAKDNLKGVPASKGRTLLSACSLNLMSCYLKTGQYDECINEGSEVLAYDAENVKALYRRGQAFKAQGQFERAVSDLTKAHEVSPDDETITDVLRDAKESLMKEGGSQTRRGLIIEEITEEEPTSLRTSNESSPVDSSVLRPQETTASSKDQPDIRVGPPSTSSEYLESLKDDPESIRSFQNLISQTDPETLAAMGNGQAEGISPDMITAASNVIGKMSPEELQRMIKLASSFQGENPLLNRGFSGSNVNSFNPGSIPADVTPDMLKMATDMMSKMSPEDFRRMSEMQSSLRGVNGASSSAGVNTGSRDYQSKTRDTRDSFSHSNGNSFNPGSIPADVTPDMLKMATDIMSKMSPEDFRRMSEMASSSTGVNTGSRDYQSKTRDTRDSFSHSNGNSFNPGSIPTDVTPDMLKMATDMMTKMSPEDLRRMSEMASSFRGVSGASSSRGVNTGNQDHQSNNRDIQDNFKINGNNAVESSTSQHLSSSRSSPESIPSSSVDLQEQMRNQMRDPAMRQMFASMMKNISPDMMANMSEQFGLKLSLEDAERAQQAMSSLSPEDLDRMMRWADKLQKGVEGVKKTKNWLLGRPGMILAIAMLLLAMFLHWLGYIGQ